MELDDEPIIVAEVPGDVAAIPDIAVKREET